MVLLWEVIGQDRLRPIAAVAIASLLELASPEFGQRTFQVDRSEHEIAD
jgi:hypothetical protein